jgi:glycosyltransferase involved in cell wall biosynthesis
VLVGSGPQETELRAQAKELRGVVFSGFQQKDTLPAYFGLASCLVLPSISEPWGLVVNEAMAAGLPVLVSYRCGCVPELVQHGVNGYLCDPFDTEEMTQFLGVMSSETADAEKMGEASRRIVAQYTPETWAQTLAECIERTLIQMEGSAAQGGSGWRNVAGWKPLSSQPSSGQDR